MKGKWKRAGGLAGITTYPLTPLIAPPKQHIRTLPPFQSDRDKANHPSSSPIRTRYHPPGDRTGTLPLLLLLMRTRHHQPGDRTGTLPPFSHPMRTWTIPPDDRTGTLPFLLYPIRIWTSPTDDRTGIQPTPSRSLPSTTTPYADLAPLPQTTVRESCHVHHTQCGSGSPPSDDRTEFLPPPHPYAYLDLPPGRPYGYSATTDMPTCPIRIWMSSPQTTVRAKHHRYYQTLLFGPQENSICGVRPKHDQP